MIYAGKYLINACLHAIMLKMMLLIEEYIDNLREKYFNCIENIWHLLSCQMNHYLTLTSVNNSSNNQGANISRENN
jgi:hypothetical protein